MSLPHVSTMYDVAIVGGGPAGLAAALALGRSRRTVALIDANAPRNRFASHMHNVIGFDGVPPSAFRDAGIRALAPYGIAPIDDEVILTTRRNDAVLEIGTASGRHLSARRLLITTGYRDVLPDLPGISERWGKDVIHCPYCHGYEVRESRLGVLAAAPEQIGHVLLMRNLSADTTLFLNGVGMPDDAIELRRLLATGVTFERRPVHELALDAIERHLVGVTLADGSTTPIDALFVATRVDVAAPWIDDLGLDMHEAWNGRWIASGMGGRTNVAGVFAAGNVADPMASVPGVVAGGSMAGAVINADLAIEDADLALAAN